MSADTKSQFILADIHGRFNHLLNREHYQALSKCQSLEEFVIKLNHYYSAINEDDVATIKDLRSKLEQELLRELDEFADMKIPQLRYFVDYNRILAFFKTMEVKRDVSITGVAAEFIGLSACKTLSEAEKLYIRGSSLEKFFKNIRIRDDSPIQRTLCLVLKNYFDYYFEKIKDGFFREIMMVEGDRQICEVCLNGASLKDKSQYFPCGNTFSQRALQRLSTNDTVSDIKEILCPGADDPIEKMIGRQLAVYSEAFKQHDDMAGVYSYFRLKEQEKNNLIWIGECIVQGNTDLIDEYIAL